jgi:DNA-directed RNA polymerase beta subunit
MNIINDISKQELYETTWKLVDTYFKRDKGYQLVKHLIDSYNDFVFTKIDNIIEGFNPIEIHHQFIPEIEKFKYVIQIDIKNITISKPMIHEKDGSTKIMTPQDARNRNFTYASPIFVELHITTQMYDEEKQEYDTEVKQINNVCLGKVPIMVGSKYCVLSTTKIETDECLYGYGGYFIINGNEKAVICQDRIAENITYVFINNKVSTYSHVAEIRSVTENKFSVPKTTSLKLSAKANQFGRFIRSNIHHVKQDIPVFILFRALGIESDKEIIEYCVPRNDPHFDLISTELVGSIEEANTVMYTRDAREYLCRYMNINGHPKELMYNKQYRMTVLSSVLEKEFLPHVGPELGRKAMYLGYMVNKLLKCYLGIIPFDDRDSYINKRIDTPGILLANLFRQYYGKVVKDMKNMIQKDINSGSWKATNKFSNVITKVNVSKIVKSTIIESGLKFGLATGNWGIKSAKTKQGVAQVLNRLSYNATISHLRRINTPIDKTGKLVQPRKLHSTQWGIICPTETPEGVSVGLVKNLAMSATITIASNSCNLRERLADANEFPSVTFFNGSNINIFQSGTKIVINGDIMGVCTEPKDVYEKIKQLKRFGVINVHSSIFWNIPCNEIWICTEAGRTVRPVYVVNEGNKVSLTKEMIDNILHGKMEWNDLVIAGVIEYLDVQEGNSSMIAMKISDLEKGFKGTSYPIKYTHLEMDPTLILGVLAGSIPFCDHNQAPRNAYQCLWLEENVIMADGTNKKIKDIQVGDEVITFDNKYMTLGSSKVVEQFVKPTDKDMYEITTCSGRIIKATYDHLFMTWKGWQRVDDIDYTSLLGVVVHPKDYIDVDGFEDRIDAFAYKYGQANHLKQAILTEYFRNARYSTHYSALSLEDWFKTVKSKGHMIFIPIESKERIDTLVIADISVESEHHSFIGGEGFAVHNSAMCKQAIGAYASSYRKRFDTLGHILHYPQQPLVYTRAANLINHDKLPSGMNVIVAIAAYTGYNQEDSVIMNQSAVDRGMFVSTYYRTYKDQNSKNHSTGEEEYYTKPDLENTKNLKPFNYDKITEDGFVPENEYVESGDVIIGKCMPQRNGNRIINKDSSVALKNNESGVIDKNSYNDNLFTNVNGDGYTFSKVRLRSERVPQIGDKCASRCYTPDHDVLTHKGWVPITELTFDHKIASLVDGVLIYQNPVALQIYNHDGRLYHVCSGQVSLCVTDNHRMYVGSRDKTNFRIMEAKDVYRKRLCYKKNADEWKPVFD